MDMAYFLITLGVLFLAGQAADHIGRITPLPRVTLLLVVGVVAGNAGFDLIPSEVQDWFDILSVVALTMVAFLLGSTLSRQNLARHGRVILSISVLVVVVTMIMVPLGLIAIGVEPALALILGAIATATAPAAVTDVVAQSGVTNRFTDTLKGVVAIDDGWGLIVFSVALVLAGEPGGWTSMVVHVLRELGGAMLLGAIIGFPAAYLTGRVSPGEPIQAEAIGVVFLAAGLSMAMGLSFLVTGMTAGAIIVNFARHHEKAFHEIEHVEWPFLLLFFLLAGASLELEALSSVGLVGFVYVVLRIVARLVGGFAGSRLGRVDRKEARLYGPALLPQAGVAVGMALVAGETFPEWSESIMALTIASTIVFELIGPPITLAAIRRSNSTD